MYVGKGLGRGNPGAVDLDAENAQIRVDMAQVACGFQRGKRFGSIAKIDEQRVRIQAICAAQQGWVVAGKEQVDAAQTILGCLATRDWPWGLRGVLRGCRRLSMADIIPWIVSGLRVCFLHE